MSGRKVLFLAQRIPYPPNKGEKIRAYHFLRHFQATGQVHLGCFVDEAEDWPHVEGLAATCAGSHFARLDKRLAKVRSARALVTGTSLSEPYFFDRGLARWVDATMRTVRPDVVFVYSSAMAQYVVRRPDLPAASIMDFVDVDSDKWRQYAETHAGPLRWVFAREYRKMLAHDRDVARRMAAGIFVSDAEAQLFRDLAPESAAKIHAVGNGVDTDYFSPDNAYPDVIGPGGPALTFTGTMDYWPNVDAVTWFADEVLPVLRRQVADVRLFIVGANPSPAVARLAGDPAITVTGRVDDVRPYIHGAAAAVAPIRVARGVQNKVLEAMAMARPTVVTSQALEGIDADHGAHVLLADDPADFAAATARILAGDAPAGLGAAARRCVEDGYSWTSRLGRLEDLVRTVGG
ncbi:MAG: TIGR03087 family PEP-CTERM/XrtA system glycosyltransferase [Hyphomicrobiales bacterium]|nr:TIGR03087 family PEP-CTERM/XrtA system glycosyltransferase [Hyphomicrobiales bacterium]